MLFFLMTKTQLN